MWNWLLDTETTIVVSAEQHNTVQCLYNAVQFIAILHAAEHESDLKLTTDIPYLTLTGELWGVSCEKIEKQKQKQTWPRYNDTALYKHVLIYQMWRYKSQITQLQKLQIQCVVWFANLVNQYAHKRTNSIKENNKQTKTKQKSPPPQKKQNKTKTNKQMSGLPSTVSKKMCLQWCLTWYISGALNSQSNDSHDSHWLSRCELVLGAKSTQ